MPKTQSHPLPPEDSDLNEMVVIAQREPAAFTPLYQHYVRQVYRYLYSRVGSQQEAEDLTAQTFLSALENLPRYHSTAPFAAWLFRIARNKAVDHFRQSGRHPETILEPETLQAPQEDPLAVLIRSEQVQALGRLVRALPQAEQELLRLRYLAGMTFPEMAAVLGRSTAAVKKRTHRLLARLQSQLELSHD